MGHLLHPCASWLTCGNMAHMNRQETLKRTLGERMVKARRIHSWVQADMAVKLGVSRRQITRWEDDQATPSTAILIAWASVCDVPFEWLAEESDGPTDLEGYLGHPSLHVSSSQVNHHSSHQAAA